MQNQTKVIEKKKIESDKKKCKLKNLIEKRKTWHGR